MNLLHDGREVTGVRCRRPYVGVVPWGSCRACRANLGLTFSSEDPPVVHCRVNGRDERAECVTS